MTNCAVTTVVAVIRSAENVSPVIRALTDKSATSRAQKTVTSHATSGQGSVASVCQGIMGYSVSTSVPWVVGVVRGIPGNARTV